LLHNTAFRVQCFLNINAKSSIENVNEQRSVQKDPSGLPEKRPSACNTGLQKHFVSSLFIIYPIDFAKKSKRDLNILKNKALMKAKS
jgi:hypothetical protein